MQSPLFKNILAAVIGYIVMFVTLFIAFTAMWWFLGPSGSFEPGSWEVSGAWIGTSIVVGLLAAKLGGFVCSKLAVSPQAVWILIAVVVVLGIASAVPDGPAASGVRPEDITMVDAMTTAAQPTWIRWLNPVIGVVGVLLGARLHARLSG